jgi:hypothetical protein
MCSNFFVFKSTFCFTNPDYRLIPMTSPPKLHRISEDYLKIMLDVRILMSTDM